jgi:hypothetical protein
MLRAAKALCLAALGVYEDPDYRAEMRRVFEQPDAP